LDKELSCTDCKYFARHYIKFKYKFYKTDCGQCVNCAIKKSERKKHAVKLDACEFWEQTEQNANDEEIETLLVETEKNLRKLARYFKSE